MKTLIVEDDAETRRAIEKWVRDGRGEARSVGTAAEALRTVESYEPHVLLVDITLPDGDGLDVLRKAREARPDIDAVVLTGSSSLDHAIEALRAGATDYLLKPFRPGRLEAVFDRIAERRRLQGELDALRDELQETGRLGEMVGRSRSMQALPRRSATYSSPIETNRLELLSPATNRLHRWRRNRSQDRRQLESRCSRDCLRSRP